MSVDALLAVMVALILASGVLFVAYLGIDAVRTSARRTGFTVQLPRRALVVKLAIGLGVLFVVCALLVVASVVGG